VAKTIATEVEIPALLTVGEVAYRLSVKPSWVYDHAEALGAFHLGKYLRFSWSRVLERLEGKAGEGLHVGPYFGPSAQLPQTTPTNKRATDEPRTT